MSIQNRWWALGFGAFVLVGLTGLCFWICSCIDTLCKEDESIRQVIHGRIEGVRAGTKRDMTSIEKIFNKEHTENLERQVELKKEFNQLQQEFTHQQRIFSEHEVKQAEWTGAVNQKLQTLTDTTQQIAQDVREIKRNNHN